MRVTFYLIIPKLVYASVVWNSIKCTYVTELEPIQHYQALLQYIAVPLPTLLTRRANAFQYLNCVTSRDGSHHLRNLFVTNLYLGTQYVYFL